MKILAIADTHFGYKIGRTPKAKRYSANKMFESFSNIIEMAKKQNVDAIIHGGDVFDRSKPPPFEINRVYNKIGHILDDDIAFIVVPGNHDRAHLPESLLMYYQKNFFQFNRPSSFQYGNLNFLGFPFEYNNPPRKFMQAVKSIDSKIPHILMCHQLFYGAQFGPHKFTFTYQEGVIQPMNLPDNLIVVTGHIHKAQVLGENNVFYPGSTERTSFVEAIEEKVVLMLDIEEDHFTYEFQKIPTRANNVLEIDITDEIIDFNEIESAIGNPLDLLLIRFTGRKLLEEEIKRLYIKFPAQDYPFLYFSPAQPNLILDPLYSKFELENIV